eukprot:SAG31_NODE_44323_length_263_cov_0.634146_1_plen_56_part_10
MRSNGEAQKAELAKQHWPLTAAQAAACARPSEQQKKSNAQRIRCEDTAEIAASTPN